MSIFSNLKALGEKHGILDKKVGIDEEYPMHARIGGLVIHSLTPFVRNANETLVSQPKNTVDIIEALSRPIGLVDGDCFYRFYFNGGVSGDDDRRFIQAYIKNDTPIEISYFERIAVFYPSDEYQFNAFFSEDEKNVLGNATFSLKRSDLEAVNYDSEELDAMFKDVDEITYYRAYGNGEYDTPLQYKEQIIAKDASSKQNNENAPLIVFETRTLMGLFSRTLPSNDKEVMMIMAEEYTNPDKDGKSYYRIEFSVGLILEADRLKIQA